eukprot:TRINITY_DN5955_c0_g1_i3.p1 TRINITY_DN5955_c0_g1~~TRINITY_DN5955_c0_g1_i3.p1  ORF type:complete len:141 (+),score=36.57 TRINITY_DN5955_c0_g1_i3:96-518(+)
MLGNAICSYVIMDLAGKTLGVKQQMEVLTYSKNAYKAFLKSLIDFEKKYHDDEEMTKEKITLADVEFIVSKVWAGSSALSQQRDNLVLVRWNKKLKPSVRNVVMLTKEEAQRHYDGSAFAPEFVQFVNKKLADVVINQTT